MKKKNLLVTCAVAGMLMGAQAAMAHEETTEASTKAAEGKNHCKGEGKNHCDGKHSCKGEKAKKDGANACSGANGCDGKMKKEETKVETKKTAE